ncbi:MAG: putative nucleic acid-binding Zn ribbon protein [Candidatus Promineifilaceae bacterium]|jgi:predicted nucleic acid-binding Zn ribbon protein
MAANPRRYTRGQWQVQRERAQIPPGPPPKPSKDPAPVRPMIESLIKKLGIAPEAWLTEMADDWSDIVGKDVAAHTRPGLLQNKCLVVYVDSSPWLTELSRVAKRSMLKKIQERFTAARLSDIRLQLDPDQMRG